MKNSETRLELIPHVFMIGSAQLHPGEWTCRLHADHWRCYHHREAGILLHGVSGIIKVPADRCVLIPPNLHLVGECVEPADQVYIHISVDGLPAPWLTRAFPVPVIMAVDFAHAQVDLLDRLHHREFRLKPLSAQEIFRTSALVYAVFAQAFRDLDSTLQIELAECLAERDRFAPALALIEEDLSAPVNVAMMAERCRLSPSHFSKMFRLRFSCTPARWQLERRLEIAAQRLIAGEDSLETIALTLGFANRFHFTRAFTRVHGDPPATYRRLHQVKSRRRGVVDA